MSECFDARPFEQLNPAMTYCFAGKSDVGNVRKSNQDAYYLDPEGRFFLLADGMGGHAGGQEASRLAVEQVQRYLLNHWATYKTPEALIVGAIRQANQAILVDQEHHPERMDMGTTIVILLHLGTQWWYAHVGDSRLYQERGGVLMQMTEDHTWIAQAIAAGSISAQEARLHPLRHVLIQCLGRADLGFIFARCLDVQPGDRLLLCSDGLTEELPDKIITRCLRSSFSPEDAVRNLVATAKYQGGRDNITVVVVEISPVSASDSL